MARVLQSDSVGHYGDWRLCGQYGGRIQGVPYSGARAGYEKGAFAGRTSSNREETPSGRKGRG